MFLGDMMKNEVFEILSEKCALPPEALANAPMIQICGGCVCIENHRGIVQYAPEEIRVNVKRGNLCIQGSNLKIALMNRRRLELRGTIRCVVLE